MTLPKTSTNETTQVLELVEQLNSATTKPELESIKSQYGDDLVRQAWEILTPSRKQQIKDICQPSSSDMTLPQQHKSIEKRETHKLWELADEAIRLEEAIATILEDTDSTT